MKMCAWCGMVIMGTDLAYDLLTKKLYHASCTRYAIELDGGIQMNNKPHWTNTDATVWDAKSKDDGHEFEIGIVTAKCSECERWSEQVNNYSLRMTYEYCPHCGKKMMR